MSSSFSLPTHRSGFSTFDRAVGGTILLLILLTALLIWGGDRAGLRVTRLYPADGAAGVSGGTVITLRVNERVSDEQRPPLTISPPISGTTRWEGNVLAFYPYRPLAPETTYTVTLDAGLESRQGRTLNEPVSWQFETRPERILYIGWDEQGVDQLFLTDRQGDNHRQLTDETFGIIDYGVSTDGEQLVYAGLRADGGSDLWQIRLPDGEPELLLECGSAVPRASCNAPAWQPHGDRLIYERRNFLQEGAPPGPPRLFWLDAESGEMAPVYDDSQQLGLGATFAPSGRWLAFVAPDDGGVQVVNLRNGESIFFPTPTGQPAYWNPAGDAVLVTDMLLRGNGFAMNLFRLAVPDGEVVNMSGDLDVEDGPPAWSPAGEIIAFGRKAPRTPMGKQIWLMDEQGNDPVKITDDADVHFGSLSWSADSETLLFQRYRLSEPGATPAIGIMDLRTMSMREIASEGLQPSWLP